MIAGHLPLPFGCFVTVCSDADCYRVRRKFKVLYPSVFKDELDGYLEKLGYIGGME